MFTHSEKAEQMFEMTRSCLEIGMIAWARRFFHTAITEANESGEFERFRAEAEALAERME